MISKIVMGVFTTTLNQLEAFQARLLKIRKDEEGATAVEYVLIIGAVALVIIVAFAALGDAIVARINDFIARLNQ